MVLWCGCLSRRVLYRRRRCEQISELILRLHARFARPLVLKNSPHTFVRSCSLDLKAKSTVQPSTAKMVMATVILLRYRAHNALARLPRAASSCNHQVLPSSPAVMIADCDTLISLPSSPINCIVGL